MQCNTYVFKNTGVQKLFRWQVFHMHSITLSEKEVVFKIVLTVFVMASQASQTVHFWEVYFNTKILSVLSPKLSH